MKCIADINCKRKIRESQMGSVTTNGNTAADREPFNSRPVTTQEPTVPTPRLRAKRHGTRFRSLSLILEI
jgi:hypothetical protein